MKRTIEIPGFLKKPQQVKGHLYRGRFTCPGVLWTGTGPELLATFTLTAAQVADAAESRLLWTDQDVQRGIQPSVTPRPPRELCLSEGYPDPEKYIFDVDKADEIAEKLLSDQKLFLSPLIWNLRPGTFSAYADETDDSLIVYEGKFYLPDSHHRHQAILKAVRLWRAARRDYPKFDSEKEFRVELYFLNREDEGNYFFAKNQLPKPTAKSKAFDLTTLDSLSLLAKQVAEQSKNLEANVNRVTDKLSPHECRLLVADAIQRLLMYVQRQNQPPGAAAV